MISIVSVIGKSGVGKTTLLEKLVPELRSRGYRIGTIKHDAHDFEIDYPGKDSWRLTRAGSNIVVLAARSRLAVVEQLDEEWPLERLASIMADRVDLILTEGYLRSATPKMEVSRRALGNALVAQPVDLLAIISDQPFSLNVPQFGLDDAPALASFLEQYFGLSHGGSR